MEPHQWLPASRDQAHGGGGRECRRGAGRQRPGALLWTPRADGQAQSVSGSAPPALRGRLARVSRVGFGDAALRPPPRRNSRRIDRRKTGPRRLLSLLGDAPPPCRRLRAPASGLVAVLAL